MTNSDGPGQQHTPLGLGEFVTGLTSLFESAGEWVLENRELLQVLLVGFGESIGDLSRYPADSLATSQARRRQHIDAERLVSTFGCILS